jgi:hypothetical protein
MKKLGRFLRRLIIVVIILLALVEIILRVALTPLYRKALSPVIEQQLGCRSSLQRGWASLLGTVGVDKLIIDSPADFPSEPATLVVGGFQAQIKVGEALQGRYHLPEVKMRDTAIAIVRNAAGALNTAEIRDAIDRLQPAQSSPPATSTPSETLPGPAPDAHGETPLAATPSDLPPLLVDNAAADVDLIIADYKANPEAPFRIDLALQARATEISTVAFGHTNWAHVTLSGAIRQAPDAYQTKLVLDLAPLGDAMAPSFQLTGEIARIDMSEMGRIQDEIGITSSNVVLSIEITAKDGVFVKGSQITARMMDARLAGEHAAKYPKLTLPPNLSITLPLTGTVAQPSCDIQAAIIGSVLKNVGNNLDYILDNTTIEGESLRDKADQEVNRLLRKLKF